MADHYVIITKSGKAITPQTHEYFRILSKIYEDYQSGGSNWDKPNKLLRNGNVVVETNLAEVAWNYGSALRNAISKASMDVQANQRPEWLT